jgi:hypothetical protein
MPQSGTATDKPRHCRNLSDRWDQGRYLYLFPSLTTVFLLAQLIQTDKNRLVLTLSLFSIGALELSSFLL